MTLYLIAHKVRGERAWDIATRMEMGDGTWWIIPTSGHRAYPYWTYKLGMLFAYENVGPPPADLPDHYPAPAQERRTRHDVPGVPTAEDL